MKHITLIEGDGIGREIAVATETIFEAAKVPIQFERVECGLEHFEKTGELIPEAVYTSLEKTRVGIKGPTTTPVGEGHRSINVTLRQKLDLFANIRPIKTIPALKHICSSPCDIDLITVRENTEDLYKGIEYKIGDDTAHGIKLITRHASQRIAKQAFELAKNLKRQKVTCVHKANIMKLTDGLFLESFYQVAADYPEIKAEDIIIDNCCMQLVRFPDQFDVLVTENLYGDILSDLASGLIGGLGLASGANIGENYALFEPVHGSAPDIAGQGIANPTAFLQSALMMLDYLGLESQPILSALHKTLEKDRTKDLGGSLNTKEFTQKIIDNL